MTFKAPSAREQAFTCPHCGTVSQFTPDGDFSLRQTDYHYRGTARQCQTCSEPVLFIDGSLVHPKTGIAPPAAEDMPKDVRALYDEAGSVSADSPRAASALLRVAVETLVRELSGSRQGQTQRRHRVPGP